MAGITLLSDFGLQDASAAVARGVLMQHAPGLSITDISHEVTPFAARQAAYLLSVAYRNFPPGTCHLVIFDLFSEPVPKLVVTAHDGQYFLAPDNGIIPLALGPMPTNSWQGFEFSRAHIFSDWLAAAGKIIKALQTSTPQQLALPEHSLRPAQALPQHMDEDGKPGYDIIHIDHYENVVVNITRAEFEALCSGRPFRLVIMKVEEITAISNNYNDVREGNKLCRFNSSGYLEICVNRGKAASLFGFRLNGRHNDIKILFE